MSDRTISRTGPCSLLPAPNRPFNDEMAHLIVVPERAPMLGQHFRNQPAVALLRPRLRAKQRNLSLKLSRVDHLQNVPLLHQPAKRRFILLPVAGFPIRFADLGTGREKWLV